MSKDLLSKQVVKIKTIDNNVYIFQMAFYSDASENENKQKKIIDRFKLAMNVLWEYNYGSEDLGSEYDRDISIKVKRTDTNSVCIALYVGKDVDISESCMLDFIGVCITVLKRNFETEPFCVHDQVDIVEKMLKEIREEK